MRFAQEINKINLEFRTAKFEYFFEVICITVKKQYWKKWNYHDNTKDTHYY